MHVQPAQPGEPLERADDGPAMLFQDHAELGGGDRGARSGDRAGANRRVDAEADHRARCRKSRTPRAALQLLQVVDVQRDARGEREVQLGVGLGGRVEHGALRWEAQAPGVLELAERGALHAETGGQDLAEHRGQRVCLHRHGMQRPIRECVAQFGKPGADGVDVVDERDGRLLVQDASPYRCCEGELEPLGAGHGVLGGLGASAGSALPQESSASSVTCGSAWRYRCASASP